MTGQFVQSATATASDQVPLVVEFADFFLTSGDGLLLSWRRYHARPT